MSIVNLILELLFVIIERFELLSIIIELLYNYTVLFCEECKNIKITG